MECLHLVCPITIRAILFLFGTGFYCSIPRVAEFWTIGSGLISSGAIKSSQVKSCWARPWLTISLINPWWMTTVSGCLAHITLWTISCNNEFKKNGKLIVIFCFKMTKSLSCHGFTTSHRPSQVMYYWMTLANSHLSSPREEGWIPLPFWVSSSTTSLKICTASCNITFCSNHVYPSTDIPKTLAIIASDTIILKYFTMDFPFYKCCKNSREISLLGIWSLVKYEIHPKHTRISLALLEISNIDDSPRINFPPIMLKFFQYSLYTFSKINTTKMHQRITIALVK